MTESSEGIKPKKYYQRNKTGQFKEFNAVHKKHRSELEAYLNDKSNPVSEKTAVKLIARDTLLRYKEEKNLKLQKEKQAYLEMGLIDPLTGLWNRRALLGDLDSGVIKDANFIPHLTREIKETERTKDGKRPLSIVELDLDFFKQTNDNYGGHPAGDLVLQRISALLSKVRGSDIVGRIGGEEFMMILPNTNQEEAILYAERIRKLIEKESIVYNGRNIKQTASFGVVQYRYDHFTPKQLIDEVDKKLYEAKNRGRNQVYPPPTATPIK